MDTFIAAIERSKLLRLNTDDFDKLAETYNSVLLEVLAKHVPLQRQTVTTHPASPWYTDEIATA